MTSAAFAAFLVFPAIHSPPLCVIDGLAIRPPGGPLSVIIPIASFQRMDLFVREVPISDMGPPVCSATTEK